MSDDLKQKALEEFPHDWAQGVDLNAGKRIAYEMGALAERELTERRFKENHTITHSKLLAVIGNAPSYQELERENARLRAALEWYADPVAYVADELENDSSLTAAWYDKGKIARKALGQEDLEQGTCKRCKNITLVDQDDVCEDCWCDHRERENGFCIVCGDERY